PHIGNIDIPTSKRSPVNGNNPVIRNSEVGATCHHPEYVRQAHEVLAFGEDINDRPNSGQATELQKLQNDSNPIVRIAHEQNGNYNFQVTPDMSRHKTPSKKLNNINYINTYYKPFYARFKAFIGSTIGKDSQRLVSRLYGVYLSHST